MASNKQKYSSKTLTRAGLALAGAAAAYLLGSWAIDTGSLWLYFATFAALTYATVNIKNLVRNFFSKHHDKTGTSRRA